MTSSHSVYQVIDGTIDRIIKTHFAASALSLSKAGSQTVGTISESESAEDMLFSLWPESNVNKKCRL